MAPELVRGERAGPETDRFALGVTLHELMTGHLPDKREVGHHIDGPFGEFIRMLGAIEPSARLKANWDIEDQSTGLGQDAPRRDVALGQPVRRLLMNISYADQKEGFDILAASRLLGRDGIKSDFVML